MLMVTKQKENLAALHSAQTAFPQKSMAAALIIIKGEIYFLLLMGLFKYSLFGSYLPCSQL
jgi:hypothetical protein